MEPLPNPDDPIIQRGDKVYIPMPSTEEAVEIIHRTRKRLSELPALPKTSNPIAIVVAYELFGLSLEDIAIAMNLTVSQVNGIKQHEAYKALKNQIVENITEAGKEEVIEIFKGARTKAATKITSLVDHARPNVALAASKTVLEATGVKLTPEAKPSNPMEGGLQIVIINGDSREPEIPEMDIHHG